ncbi:MAG: ABC transporter permease [Planctomycetota bacterium]|nr:ABC transporter permease [Planctomycetota bacterium]
MLRLAIRNLLSRPARSTLSLMGLTVAIVGMVGLFSVAEGIDATIQDTFGKVPGIIVMQRGSPIPIFSRVPRAWAKEVEQLPGVNAVSPEIWIRANIIDGKTIISPPRVIFGCDVDAQARVKEHLYRSAIIEGRYLTPEDRGTGNAVVSRQIAEEFGIGIGDSFVVNSRKLDIVGLYFCGSLLLDSTIIADDRIVREMSLFDENTISSFYVELTGEIPKEEMIERLNDHFRGRELHSWSPVMLLGAGASQPGGKASNVPTGPFMPSGNPVIDLIRNADRAIKKLDDATPVAESPVAESPVAESTVEKTPSDEVPLDIQSADDLAEKFSQFSEDLDIFLTLMTGIGLTIAVLSILNTMLMSVSERIIEFGILKANGWSQGDVMKLITAESATLGFAGGFCGCVLGWVLTQVVNWKWSEHIHLLASPGLLVFSLVFATLLGVGGGLYPALWATRMMPMDAIRRG